MQKSLSLLVLSGMLLASTACVSTERYDAASQEIDNQDEVIRELRRKNTDMAGQLERLRNELDLAKMENARLKGNEAAADELARLKKEFADLKNRFTSIDDSVTMRQTSEGTALSVEGEVLFQTASDKISTRGEEILAKICERLLQTNARIRIDGHTDNVPIVKRRGKYPLGNLELSGARALQVAWFLTEKCNFPRDRVYYAGYGQERPVASNETEEGRRRNRRVEILLLGE